MSLNGQQVAITPYAILAAILFNVDKVEPVMVTPDDGGEPTEVQSNIVGIEAEDDALVCVIPAEKVMHFASTTYDCNVMTRGGHMFVSFERRKDGGGLLTASGKPAPRTSFTLNRLMERLGAKP